ncbi:MAG: transposase [Thermodesulfobacteriota bacterium]|nr:transposase [Thermodesulfobacteriota bacterium]
MTKKSNKITVIDVPAKIDELKFYLKQLKGSRDVVGQDAFVLDCLDRQIQVYNEEKAAYEKEFKNLAKKYPPIRHQDSLPGIGHINAVKIVARVVSPYRFADKGHFWSYAGLIKHEKISGQRSYGKRTPRYSEFIVARSSRHSEARELR